MTGHDALDGPEFLPHVLREYALLADGERGVLVGPRGDFAWMCFPRWHSPALFASLIGGRGAYTVTPEGRYVWGGFYEPGSLIWHGRWTTEDGIIESREALALPSSSDRAVILRRIKAIEGGGRIRVRLDLRSNFGSQAPRSLRRDESGRWVAKLNDGCCAVWAGAAEATLPSRDHPLHLELILQEGDTRDLVLTVGRTAEQAQPIDPWAAWLATEARWRETVPGLEGAVGARDARHAYAVLAGLTSADGGMVAAATTSLPERADRARNYDYRFAWIRDQCYAGEAVASAGRLPLLDDAVRFVRERLLEDGPHLKPAYTVEGRRIPDESRIDLPGYPGSISVVGNWVNRQFQLDSFGEALLLFAAAGRLDRLDADTWRAAEAAVDAIQSRWGEPDAGLWEIEPRAWTHSRLICVAGLRAISRRPEARGAAGQWSSLADRILADTGRVAVHPTGRWQRAADDPRVDAALLLPAIRGAVPSDDPRSAATLRAVLARLTEDGYCYRYRPDDQPLGRSEGAFLLCGFIVALAQRQQGNHLSAARWFERTRAACGPPGLLSEEFDVQQRQLRGNLPQAFVHALLFECAIGQGCDESSSPSSAAPHRRSPAAHEMS